MQLLEKLWKIGENIREKLETTERRRNYLVSEQNYHGTKFFTEDLLAIEIRKTQILMNELAHLGLSISDLSKTVMYEFRLNYVKPKYCENAKLCYRDIDSFIVHLKKKILQDLSKQDLTL